MLQWRQGLRISEALGVTAADVDHAENTITVTGKGDKTRTLPMHESIATIFKSTMRPADGEPYVQADRTTIWRRYRLAGLPDTHCLRHSAARHWLNQNVPMNEVSLLLGHASLQTTVDRYLPLVSVSKTALAGIE